MVEQHTRWTRTVQYNTETKEYFIDLKGIAEHMGWNIEDELEWIIDDSNRAILKKKEQEKEV
jgi:hypothetical protein